MTNGTVEFYGELKAETERGVLVFDGDNKIWLPKSQILEMRKIKDSDYEFEIPYWLAKEKEII